MQKRLGFLFGGELIIRDKSVNLKSSKRKKKLFETLVKFSQEYLNKDARFLPLIKEVYVTNQHE